jgi:hypothetical protein
LATLGTAAGLFIQSSLFAQGYDDLGSYGNARDFESEQYGAVELRFGPYVPKVDDEVAGTPYEDMFGDKFRLTWGFEVDWQFLRIPAVGTLGVGGGWSRVKASAKARFAADGLRSGETTSLTIMPMHGVVVLRVDTLSRNLHIPFVPYAKLGGGYALWTCHSGGTRCRAPDGTLGRGAEYGYVYALGLMLELDWLDPQSSRDMDNSMGVNNSYLFGELFGSDISSFGSGMQVGTQTWVLGLAFEF